MKLTQKIAQRASNLIESPSSALEKLSAMKELKILKYNRIFVAPIDDYLNFCAFSMQKLSKCGLQREKPKLEDSEKCYFIGKKVTFGLISFGRWSTKFEIVDGGPCDLVEVGFGRPIGKNKIMSLIDFIIVKNDEIVNNTSFLRVMQEDFRITYGIKLEKNIELKKGDVCQLIYSGDYKNCYAIKCKKTVFDLGPLKIKFIDHSRYADFICYLKIV